MSYPLWDVRDADGKAVGIVLARDEKNALGTARVKFGRRNITVLRRKDVILTEDDAVPVEWSATRDGPWLTITSNLSEDYPKHWIGPYKGQVRFQYKSAKGESILDWFAKRGAIILPDSFPDARFKPRKLTKKELADQARDEKRRVREKAQQEKAQRKIEREARKVARTAPESPWQKGRTVRRKVVGTAQPTTAKKGRTAARGSQPVEAGPARRTVKKAVRRAGKPATKRTTRTK